MKRKLFILTALSVIFIQRAFSQESTRVPGPMEKKLTDSVCKCVTNLDLSKITNKQEAVDAYSSCVTRRADMLADLAAERKVEMSDYEAMKKAGVDLALNLMKEQCPNFMKLAVLFNQKGSTANEELVGKTEGVIKRIDNKGFNYLVITDKNNTEKSFLWLKEFPGSEKFMTGTAKFAGKKLNISWQEMEVYLPLAKGYYKVKEITAIDIL
jgi:hypothetical protein